MLIHNGSKIPDSPCKDPDSVIDYGFKWAGWLAAGEIIVASDWITDLTVTASSNNGSVTSAMLSGGVADQKYLLTNRVTTNHGRKEDRSMTIRCQNK